MKKLLLGFVALSLFIITSVATSQAVVFSPKFSDYPFLGTQFDVDAAANAYFNTNYGITITNMYLYKDVRDTFDGVGVANGYLNQAYSPATGKISFTDTTNFVTINWLAIQSTIFSVYDNTDHLLQSLSVGTGTGTSTLTASNISYLTVGGIGGFSAVSDLTYNYDGTTDGRNNDTSPIPEPSTLFLLGAGLAGLGFLRRRGSKQA